MPLARLVTRYCGSMPVALIWLIGALVLAGAEVLTGDLSLLMLGGAALATAGADWLFGWPVWADGLVFVIVSVLLLAGVRPMLRRRLAVGAGLPEPMKALEGKSALVIDRVARHEGQVKLDGQVWTARPLNEDDIYLPGDHVTVVHIDGATAVVSKIV
jgi:membrane protein implicated in regulation of membrane protease activity